MRSSRGRLLNTPWPDTNTITGTYRIQIRGERDREVKVRDSQKWKRVELKAKRSYAELARRSTYGEDPDIGSGQSGAKQGDAGRRESGQGAEQGDAVQGESGQGAEAQAEEGQGVAGGSRGLRQSILSPAVKERMDIKAKLRRNPIVIQLS